MAKVVLFIRDELYSGEWERNNKFREIVKSFVPFIVDDPTYYETSANTRAGFAAVFDKNPDCELVFTAENNCHAQYAANSRGILTFEWRCFSDPTKLVPIKISKEDHTSFCIFRPDHYGIRIK